MPRAPRPSTEPAASALLLHGFQAVALADGRWLQIPAGTPMVVSDARLVGAVTLAAPAPTVAPAAPTPPDRELCERYGYAVAAERLGVSPWTLRSRAKRFGWSVPDGRALRRLAAAEPTAVAPAAPSRPVLEPEVRTPARGKSRVRVVPIHTCPACRKPTDEDPCHRCKAPWGEQA